MSQNIYSRLLRRNNKQKINIFLTNIWLNNCWSMIDVLENLGYKVHKAFNIANNRVKFSSTYLSWKMTFFIERLTPSSSSVILFVPSSTQVLFQEMSYPSKQWAEVNIHSVWIKDPAQCNIGNPVVLWFFMIAAIQGCWNQRDCFSNIHLQIFQNEFLVS